MECMWEITSTIIRCTARGIRDEMKSLFPWFLRADFFPGKTRFPFQMAARSGRRIIRSREWVEIAKNSRKRICTGGCSSGAWTEGVRWTAGKETHYGSWTDSSYELLHRCSINECRT